MARNLLGLARRSCVGGYQRRGLNFDFNEDTLMLQDLARKFAREEMLPAAAEYDVSMEYPQDIFTKAWELGLGNFNLTFILFIYENRLFVY